MNQQEILESIQEPVQERPAPARYADGTGLVFFGGLAGLVTALHLATNGPGHPLDTVSGILYTIGAISLSPFFFHALLAGSGSVGTRFAGAYLGLFFFTAPVYYAPDFIGYGMALGLVCLLMAILPAWFRYFSFQGAIQGIEDYDPDSLLDALKSEQSPIRSMARIRLIELGEEAIPGLIAGYRRATPLHQRLRANLLDILKQLSFPVTDPKNVSRHRAELMAFWREQLETSQDYDVLNFALGGVVQARDAEAHAAAEALFKRELKRGGGLNRSRDQMFDLLFAAMATLGEGRSGAGEGAQGIQAARDLIGMMLETYLMYPGARRAQALQSMGAPVVAACAARIPQVNSKQRQELIKVLVGIPAVAALPVLLELCQDPALETRLSAMSALIEGLPRPGRETNAAKPPMPDAMVRQVVDALIRMVGDPVDKVRLTAIEGLSQAALPQTMPILLDYVSSPPGSSEDTLVRGRVAANLARTRDPLVIEPLMRLLESGGVAALAGAARGLGYLKDPRIPARLQALLKHPELQVVESAALGLARQGDMIGKPILLKALDGSPILSRLEVLEALMRDPDERVYTVLEAGIGNPSQSWSAEEREWSIRRLIEAKKPEGHAVLERLWKRDSLDEGVRGVLRAQLKAAGMLAEARASTSDAPKTT